jgi:phage tail sheath protein FI
VQSWRNRFDTEFAALYFPWIFVRDPLVTNQVVRRIPPSGHVAGVYANSDLTVGVHNAPANTPVQWAQALTTEVTANMQGVLNPAGVDCLRVFPGRGLRVFGARTMSSDSSWRFVNVRRLMSMIEHSLLISLQWSVFEPNNAALWNKILVAVSSFLEGIWRGGGLAGNTAEDSFYVKCDATNNPPALNQVGQLVIEIGVAPVIPAEFIIFRIGRSEDTLEVTEV